MKKSFSKFPLLEASIFCLLFFTTIYPETIVAQQGGGYTPGKFLDSVIDNLGNKYSLGQISVNDTIRGRAWRYPTPLGSEVSTCSSGYFQMYMETGCGLEGTSAANVARRNVICRVLYDLSQFIYSPLDTVTTGQKINIWVRNPDSVGNVPSNLLGAAGSFYNVPNSATISGIQDNTVWITLNSGKDAYTNVASPLMTEGGIFSDGASFFHGWMVFRFDSVNAWNTNLSSPPGNDTFDLYTVALHEMCHALGFVSLINYDGTSKLGVGYTYYTRYDEHLYSGATPLIKTSASCNLYQWAFNTSITPPESVLSPGGSTGCALGYDTGVYIDDTVCTHAVNYVDASPMTQKVYTPNCYEPVSSLSHFDDLCAGSVPSGFVPAPPSSDHQYFLMGNATIPGPYVLTSTPGAMKRFPRPEERQVLCDIGYIVDTTFGNSVNLNFNNYHTTICGNQVAGIDDGITAGGLYTFFTIGTTPVAINGGSAPSILSNDYNADSFKCLEVIAGAGTLSATSGTSSTLVNFTPAIGAYGVQLLRYTPVNSATGAEGNITYVYAYVGDASCTPSACNLVANGGFESTNPAIVPYEDGAIHCWTTFSGSPDLWSRNPYGYSTTLLAMPSTTCYVPSDVHYPIPTTLHPNNHFIALEGWWPPSSILPLESVQSPLSSSLISGNTYEVSCWGKISNSDGYTVLPFHVQLAVSPSTVAYASVVLSSFPVGFTELCHFNLTSPGIYTTPYDGWQHYDTTFTYTGPTANTIAVINAAYLNPTTGPYAAYNSYILVDDLSIIPSTSVCYFNLPMNLNSCSNIINLDSTVSIPGGTFSWQTIESGVVATSYDSMFNPTLAYNASDSLVEGGLVTVCYYYTDALGCSQTVCATTNIAEVHQIHGDTLICAGSTTALTDSASGGTWSSGNTSIATVNSSGVVAGVSQGTATISYTVTSGCVTTDVVTVHAAPTVITGASAVCVNSTITLTDSATSGTWSSGNTGVATIDSLSGVVLGRAAGICAITYANSCGSAVDSITVNPLPMPISGPDSVCVGSSILLTDATHTGTWTITPSSVATITVGGVLTGLAGGGATVRYTIHSTGCYVSDVVIVHTLPPAIYSPTAFACVGDPFTLIDSAEVVGTWSSSNTTVATIDPSGDFYGWATGSVTITYTGASGCYVTYEFTVNPSPAAIIGIDSVCVGGTVTLSDPTRGGTWRSSDLSIATITARTGIATGVAGGVDTIDYIATTGCYAMFYLTVDPAPSVIAGPVTVCVGSTIVLTDSVAGGTWSSGYPAIATVDSVTGIITGISEGNVQISYTNYCGTQYTVIMVNPTPLPIMGGDTLCVGSGLKLTDFTPDGTWSSSVTTVATFTSPGILYGVSVGTTVVSYTLSTGCAAIETVDVLTPPTVDTIAGYDSTCIGGTLTFSDDSAGGFWSSSNTTVATVNSLTGVISGLSGGTATISYIVTNYCGTTIQARVTYINAIYPLPAITGAPGVCSGTYDTLSDAVAGGTWTSSAPGIAGVDPAFGVVYGISSGSATITYTAMEFCGPAYVTKTVNVNMLPYITTNTVVACMALSGLKGGGGFVLPDSTCILVCDSSTITYYGNGDAGSSFTWVVSGGIVLHNYGDSIIVVWPIAGTTGTITLFDTVSHCTGEYVACVQVIQRPHADFSASADNICLGTNVLFTDLSTADISSPIVSWNWNFGDGSYSSARNPSHTFSSAGTDTVTLVVRNACNCTDTFKLPITVSPLAGQIIQCSSVICDSGISWYTTTGGCGTYNWSVIGGAIIAGAGSDSIEVVWNSADSSGFGYVNLAEPCALCPDTTTIRVPVILQSAQIMGLDTICAGTQYEYSFPLWPATQYMWGVLGSPYPGIIVGANNDYKAIVDFPTAGTDTIHAWYQNRIALCGGNLDKVITVVPPTSIVGSTTVCQSSSYTYSLADSTFGATWTLSNITTGAVVTTSSGLRFTNTFDSTGVFLLTATGAFCANPITITVTTIPPPIDSLSGLDTVCLNRVYVYSAYYNVSGSVYSWTAVGGTVTPASGSSNVNITWTSGGAMDLEVNRISTSAPYCPSRTTTISITQEIIDPHVTGDSLPCANSYRAYNANYTRGEVYDWAVYPDSVGSVTGGNNGAVDTILWNNVAVATPTSIVLTVRKCDSVVTDTLHVTVQPSPLPAITVSPSPACPQDSVTFTVGAGDSAYVWDFGDGTPMVTTTADSVKHAFPINTTTSNAIYTVKVTAAASRMSFACPPTGTNTTTIAILPGPVAYASTANYNICPPETTVLVGTVTSNVTGLAYQWSYQYGGAISGAISSTYTADSGTTYDLLVTASNGCSSTSSIFISSGCLIGDCTPLTGTASATCRTAYLHGNTVPAYTTGYYWYAPGTPRGAPCPGCGLRIPGVNATAIYDIPGIYACFFGNTADTCSPTTVYDTIGVVPNFRYELQCASGGLDSIFLSDYTVYLPFFTLYDTAITWSLAGVIIPNGPNVRIALAAPGTYTITETVIGTGPDGTYSCDTPITITIPGLPHAAFTDTLSPICEGVPINFTATSTAGIVAYRWNFGDSSSSFLHNPQRTYNFRPSLTDPETYIVTLTVTDSIGCVGDTSETVAIYDNLLGGFLGPNQTVCSNDAPVIIPWATAPGATSPILWEWSNGVTNTTGLDTVDVTGTYWVTVFDANQCRGTFPLPAVQVKILSTPVATIMGLQNYCIGSAINLSSFDGTGVSYEWLRNGLSDGSTYTISDAGLPPAAYEYEVIVGLLDTPSGVTCYDTSATDTVYMHGLPPVPVISGPTVVDCSSYHLELTAIEPESGTYNWSNGTTGAVDDIYSGGPYRVWFTDNNGCINEADVSVPLAPSVYFPYFPTGCYTLCIQQLPITIFGPPDVFFNYWAWLMNGDTTSSGTLLMMPDTIKGAGSYQMTIGNLVCSQTTDAMSVDTIECSVCGNGKLTADVSCNPSNPASYSIVVNVNSPGPGTTYRLGTDIGPIDPFSGTFTTGGVVPLTLSFTTLYTSPLPDSVTVEVAMTLPDGAKCFQTTRVALPPCAWETERQSSGDSANADTAHTPAILNALLVYPNPSSGDVTISYDYGKNYDEQSIAIFDATGRTRNSFIPQDARGNWTVNTSDWTPGLYIIRMEADGIALQTQRLVVVSK